MELSAFKNLFADLQSYVADILDKDETLSAMGARFVPENSLDIEYEAKTALAKQGLACIVMTPQAKYQGHDSMQQTFTCEELTLQIVENPVVNRARLKKEGKKFGTASDVAKAASDRLAGPQGGYFGQFTTKNIEESEQGGLLVCTATFGCTVFEKLDAVISGDLSGHWVEVPFVRMDELSSWISSFISGWIPEVSVDLTDYRQKDDLSAYSRSIFPWTASNGQTLSYDKAQDLWKSASFKLQMVHGEGEDPFVGWQLTAYEMEEPYVYDLGGDLSSLELSASTWYFGDVTFTRQQAELGDLSFDGDFLVLSSQLSDDYTNSEIDDKIRQMRYNLDLSVYSGKVRFPWDFFAGRFAPTEDDKWSWSSSTLEWSDESGWTLTEEVWDDDSGEYVYVQREITEGKDDKYALRLVASRFMYVDEAVFTREGVDHFIQSGEMIATTGLLEQYRKKDDYGCYNPNFAPWTDANGNVFTFVPVDQPQIGGRWNWRCDGVGSVYLQKTGSDTRRGSLEYIGIGSQFINDSLDVLSVDLSQTSLSAASGGWIRRQKATPDYYGISDKLVLSSDLSTAVLPESLRRGLSASASTTGTKIQTYDGTIHTVYFSQSNINVQTFQQYGFTYDDDPLSGIMNISFGRELPADLYVNMYTSKVKNVICPPQLSVINQRFCNGCPELETFTAGGADATDCAKLVLLQPRVFSNCPKLSRVEIGALSVKVNGENHFTNTQLTATVEGRPWIKPGLYVRGWLSSEASLRESMSALSQSLDLSKIHVLEAEQPDVPALSGYLPLSGGELSGQLSWSSGTADSPYMDAYSDGLIIGADSLGSNEYLFKREDVAQSPEDVMRRKDLGSYADKASLSSYLPLSGGMMTGTLSVGAGGWSTKIDPGSVSISSASQSRSAEWMWDGVVVRYGTSSPQDHANFTLPLSGGTFATREYVKAETQALSSQTSELSTSLDGKVQNEGSLSGMMAVELSTWQDISADASPQRLYVVLEEE